MCAAVLPEETEFYVKILMDLHACTQRIVQANNVIRTLDAFPFGVLHYHHHWCYHRSIVVCALHFAHTMMVHIFSHPTHTQSHRQQ